MNVMITEDQWNKINRLARLKIEDISEMFFANLELIALNEMGSSVNGRTQESLSCVIRDIWISRLDDWLMRVINCYMKALSGLKIDESPEILARIHENGILPAVDEYLKTCLSKWNAHERFLTVPFPYKADFNRYAKQLIKKVHRKFEIRSLELIPQAELEHKRATTECTNLADSSVSAEIPSKNGNPIEVAPSENEKAPKFNPNQYGGKEVCIVVSYHKDGQSDMARLSRILANKADIKYKRGEYRDPKLWCQKDLKGFTNHVYRLRKKAGDKGWTDAIPQYYWRSYNS
jgi:hypothetical protein